MGEYPAQDKLRAIEEIAHGSSIISVLEAKAVVKSRYCVEGNKFFLQTYCNFENKM